MAAHDDSADRSDAAAPDGGPTGPGAGGPTRDGRSFVLFSGIFLVLLALVLLFVSPRLQAQLGLTEAQPFPTPPSEQRVELTAEGAGAEDLRGTAIWDAQGVCAEVTGSDGTTFRTCATPDPLRPFWAIDAPDDAADGFLLIATPPEVMNVEGLTVDGQTFGSLVQTRELPVGWALIALPDGAVVDRLVAFDTGGSDVGDALCGHEDAPTDGPDRLQGGCFVERQD